MVMLQRTVRRPSGYGIVTLDGKETDSETLSCCHCQFTWTVVPGSGLKRGWCFLCQGPTCGKRDCESRCAPWEKQVELTESRARFGRQLEKTRR